MDYLQALLSEENKRYSLCYVTVLKVLCLGKKEGYVPKSFHVWIVWTQISQTSATVKVSVNA